MEIKTIDSFLNYYEATREITNCVIQVIPREEIEWSYKPGKFTIGDLVRHLAAVERNIFAEVVSGNPPAYKGCGKDLADGFENILSYFNEMHLQSTSIFSRLTDQDLSRDIKSLNGKEVKIGSFLRALFIHEIHHRGALCIYLNILNVTTPSILGLTEEDIIKLSK